VLPSGAADPGIVTGADAAAFDAFATAVARHRHPERETDPPKP